MVGKRAVAAVMGLPFGHVTCDTVIRERCVGGFKRSCVARHATAADLKSWILRHGVGVVARTAPQCLPAFLDTPAQRQLFDVADDLEPSLLARIVEAANEDRPEFLEPTARLERTECLSGIQDPHQPGQVALLANAISFSRGGFRRIEDGS